MSSRKTLPPHLEGYMPEAALHEWLAKQGEGAYWIINPVTPTTTRLPIVRVKLTWPGKAGTYHLERVAASFEEATWLVLEAFQAETHRAKPPPPPAPTRTLPRCNCGSGDDAKIGEHLLWCHRQQALAASAAR